MIKNLLAAFLFSSLATNAATSYFIDFTAGNDANNGTAKATPFKRHPYMKGFTGSYSHSAGDRFIFKGGSTWPNSCFQMKPPLGGSAGNIDYYGTDQTWFTGGSWTRPFFDLQHIVLDTSVDGAAVWFFNISYITVDGIEIANLRATQAGNTFGPMSILMTGTLDHYLITNCIARDWDFDSMGAGQDSNGVGGFGFLTGIGANDVTVSHCQIYDTAATIRGGCALRNIETTDSCEIHHVVNAILGGGNVVKNSNIHDMWDSSDPNSHGNGIETFGQSTIYGNLIYNLVQSVAPILLETSHTGNVGTNLVYNNVMWNTGGQAPVCQDNEGNGTVNQTGLRCYNNTIDGGSGFCVRLEGRGVQNYGIFDVRNNHLMTTGTAISVELGAGTLITTPNVIMTPGAGATFGYTPANFYQPSGLSSPTVGVVGGAQGNDLSAFFNTDRLGILRPQFTVWDFGAYEFASTGGSPGNFQLSATAYSTTETSGQVVVTVNRINGTTGIVSVTVATSNGTATSGHDYTATSTTFTWLDGQTGARNLPITVLNSGDTSLTPRTFLVTLSAASGGATITGINPVTVTINMTPPPTQFTFNITSANPASGVTIAATTDANGQSAGVTAFTRVYAQGTSVTLTAPGNVGANTFTQWNKDGVLLSALPGITATADAAHTFNAIYGSPPPPTQFQLMVNSSPSGAVTTVSPNDVNGAGNGVSPFSRTYTSNTLVSLTVPASGFVKWQRDGSDYSTSAATNVLMGAAHTMLAVYQATNGGTLGFSGPSYTVSSAAGHVTITVNSVGSLNVARTVQYATTGGSAVAGTDYTAVSGQLSWSVGDNSPKTFSVPVLNTGAIGGPPRLFTVSLNGPTGGASLALSQATVSITPQQIVGVQATVSPSGSLNITGKVVIVQ